MAEHRASPACANCHRIMDPLGFALENFDAVGELAREPEKRDRQHVLGGVSQRADEDRRSRPRSGRSGDDPEPGRRMGEGDSEGPPA
jgi:hypothetical protein